MQRRTKENGIYLSSVGKSPVINCCEVPNSAGTEVLWGGGGGRSAFRRTSRFSKVLNIQKFGFKEQ